ncbi:MAG: aspartyl protease family protein [candidate division Zixibacteria bacterium]|nr:aspartyl protease family protein [candidate division Zixibacteria bacterium]MDH3938159.1 aspartyl protease family protein [candidate division Zixibacteria bacterium]MDH4033534.1 aspartyl protease family protein [candidate division Zixibacteria bacterium]
MNRSLAMSLSVLVAFALSVPTVQGQLSDPYEILNRHYEAMGGLEKLKAQKSSYMEATIDLVGTGLKGTLHQWSAPPIRSRQDVDLKVLTQKSGDNGEYAWNVDSNGKLQIRRDEDTEKQRKLQALMAEFDQLEPNSQTFKVTLEGSDTAAGVDCYVVQITNSLNEDVSRQHYDKTTFMLLKTVAVSPQGESHTWFLDYREVDGIINSFKQESITLPDGMKQIVIVTKLEINLPVEASIFEPPVSDVEDFRFTNGRDALSIPFEFIENHIYLPVTIGGKKRLWVLDTGASVTVIDKAYALELGLTLEGQIKGQGAGNLVDVSFTRLPPFELAGLEFDEQRAASIEVASLFDRWLGMEVVGILGYDFLSRLVTRVDYANETLSFYHPDSFTYHGDGTILESPISQSNFFELPVSVDGKHGGKWMLDLGAGGMSFHYPYAEQNGILTMSGVDGLGHGAGGSQPKRSLQFETIEFAGHTIANPIVGTPLVKGQGGFGHTDLTGNIGNTLLRHFVLYLDYKREQVIVEKGDNFAHVFPRDNSGMQLENSESNQVRIIFVADNTPAAQAGFNVGDVLLAVDDVDMAGVGGVLGVKKLLRQQAGTSLSVAISRGDEKKKLTLTLADLYN